MKQENTKECSRSHSSELCCSRRLSQTYLYVRATRTAAKSDSSKWEQLTFFTDAAVYPELSPDGRLLTFIRGKRHVSDAG